MSVYKKLQEARVKFHSKSLKKTGENKFAKYFYFELGDFLPTIQEVFHEVGLVGVCSFTADVATLRVVDADKPDDVIEFTSPMGSADLKGCHVVQNIGAVETYQRRYLWVAAMEIVEHDVLDATTGKDEPKKKASEKGSITPTTGAIEALDTPQQQRAASIAKRMQELWSEDDRDAAYNLYFHNDLDTDMKAAVWAGLKSVSAMRSELKHMNEQRRA